MKKDIRIIILLVFFGALTFTAHAQYFGQNKVNYEVFDFKIYETPHFSIYHYIDDEEKVKDFGQLCERWYKRHQNIFVDTLTRKKNPVILYNDHADFQQTTVIQQLIGVGTGGVTEGYRNRLIMPYSASNNETDHVLGHEMVHVFQYNMFKQNRNLGLRSMGQIPLWMIEGLAEYLSIGTNHNQTAIWMRDAVIQDDIPTFREMSRDPQSYFPYRYGHAFWSYFTALFGDGAIRPLLQTTGRLGYEKAIEAYSGYSADSLSSMWIKALEKTHQPYLEGKDESSGEKLFDESNAGEINIAPSLSHDGKNLVFISDRNVISIDYYLADVDNKEITKQLTNVIRASHIDAYSFLESSGTWSPDGKQFALTSFSKGQNTLIIVDLEDEKIVETIRPDDLQSFNNPQWSPDGEKMLLSGLKNGQSDLYLYYFEDGSIEQLTNDRYSDLHPHWSPDGSKILFISDRGEMTDLDRLKYGNYRLTEYDLNTREIDTIDILKGSDIVNPKYSPDGTKIYFVSDADGYRNIYRYDKNIGEVRKITDLKTGVIGITGLSPCFDISRESEELVYILYTDGGYELFRQDLSTLEGTVFAAEEVDFSPSELVSVKTTIPTDFVNENLNTYFLPDTNRFGYKPYDAEFKLETIGSSGIGVGVNRYGTGMAGGVSFLFNDMLKRHLLMTALQVQGRIYDIAGQVFYLNQASRFNWGVSFSHIPYRSSGATIKADTIQDTPVQNLVLMEQRTFEDELGVMGQYPISKKLRIETGFTASRYSFRIDSINNYFYRGVRIGRESQEVDGPDPFYLFRSYAAYAGDDSQFGLTSPMRGYRYRFQTDKVFGEFDYWGFLADYRKYFFFFPDAVGFRLMHYGRYGSSADELYPMFLGNEYYVRGYSFGSMSRNPSANGTSLNVNNLVGSKMVVGNIEYRLPLSGPKRLAMIQSGMFFTDLVLFADGGLIWSDFDDVEFNWEPTGDDVHIPIYSAGLAIRLNLFGAIILEPYYAFPFQRPEAKSSGTFGLHLSAGGF